ncbi:MAG: carbohydrate-binding family 9-like protein [Phycisphaerales bacterium]|nr:carbohydrate-binding family 9-like protein [Phycisphaerales bacterium]
MLKMGILAIVGALICGCVGAKVGRDAGPERVQAPEGRKVYSVIRVAKAEVKIDGRMDEPVWQQCQLLSDFTLPWEAGVTPQRTEFRVFCDSENLYFGYKAWEATPAIVEKWSGKNTLNAEDRVEIYFSPDWEMKSYYCIEIDALGRVHDFKGVGEVGARKFDHSWDCEGLKVAATRGEGFYSVTGSIPLKTLRAIGMPENGLPVGLFRADLERMGGGSDGKLISHWISWADLRGHKVSFHMPEALGVFLIVKK